MAPWCSGVTTAHFHSTKPELRFYAGSNPVCGVSEIRDGEDLWQRSRLEIRLNALRRSTIPQKKKKTIHKNISDVSRRNFAINKEINTAKFTKKFNTITETSKVKKIYLLVVSHVKSPTIWKPDSSSLFVRLLDVNMSVGDAHWNYVISKIAEIYCLLPLNIVMNLTKESIRKKWLKI